VIGRSGHEAPAARPSIFLKAKSQRRDDHHVILLEGEADAFTAPVARDALAKSLRADAKVIVVDLTGVTFIDSTMLGIFIDATKRLRARGGAFGIACANEHIRKVFRITGLDGLIQVYVSACEAVSSLTEAQETCTRE
jgi:anti-sigma B factor antagonist